MPINRHIVQAPTRIRHAPQAPTGIRLLGPGDGIGAHRHDDHQIVYASRGVLSITTDAGSWVAPANRAIWIPAGTVHQHRAYGDTDLRLIGLTQNPLRASSPTVLAVKPLLRELIISYTEEQDPLVRAVLLDQLRRAPEQPIHLPTPKDARLAGVCQALMNDPADPRTIRALGAQSGVSDRTLARLFKRELGMSFPQWRTQLRLHHALLLLAEGMAVTTVAHRCGWASASAFIDAFRRAFGYTPGKAFRIS